MGTLITAEAAQDISVDMPDGFGGVLYNVSASINYGSSSEFECSFLIDDSVGSSDISDEYLNTEEIKTLTINGSAINVFPVSYNKRKNANEDVVLVKYRDSSVKYLDKTLVMLLGLQASQQQEDTNNKIIAIGRFVSTYNIDEDEIRLLEISEGDKGYENYDPNFQVVYPLSALKDGILQKGIPMSQRCSNLLSVSTNSRLCKSYFGNLRSALSSWGADLGLLFFWNIFENGGSLDCLDITDPVTFSQLPTDIESSYYKYITSLSQGSSIEDTFTKNGAAISVIPIENSESTISISSVGSYKFWAFDPVYEILKGLEDFSVAKKDINMNVFEYKIRYKGKDVSDDFKKAVSAALAGPDFFKKYLIYTMINGAIAKDSTMASFREEKGLVDQRTGESYSITGGEFPYNSFLYDYYYNFYRVAFCGVFKKSEFDKKNYDGKGYVTDVYGDLSSIKELISIWAGQDDAPVYAAYLVSNLELFDVGDGYDAKNYMALDDIESDVLFNRLSLFGKYIGRFFFREFIEQSFNRVGFRDNDISWYEENLSVHSGTQFSELATFLFPDDENPKIKPFVKDVEDVTGGLETRDLSEREFSYTNKLRRDGIAIFDSGETFGANSVSSKIISDAAPLSERASYKEFVSNVGNKNSKPFLIYFATKSSDLERELSDSNVRMKGLKHYYAVYDKTSGSGNVPKPPSPPVIERRLNNLSDKHVVSNSIETSEVSPEDIMLTYKIKYGADKIEKDSLGSVPKEILSEYADAFFYIQNSPSVFKEYSLSKIPSFTSDWISRGLETISISYGGESMSCGLKFSTQRRASYTMEMMSRKIAQNLLGNKNYSDIKDSFNKFPVRFKNKYLRPS